MVDQPILLDGADTGDLDARGDGVMERLADPANPMYQAITRLVMRELTMRRDPEFEGFLHESDDHEFLEFRLAVLVALDRVWDDLRGQNDARRGQFVHRMEALEGAEDRGEVGAPAPRRRTRKIRAAAAGARGETAMEVTTMLLRLLLLRSQNLAILR